MCLEDCATVAGRKNRSDIKKTTYKSAAHCAEGCTTNRVLFSCADRCYKKFANDAQKAVDSEVKKCQKKCDGDKSCEKKCDNGKNLSTKKM